LVTRWQVPLGRGREARRANGARASRGVHWVKEREIEETAAGQRRRKYISCDGSKKMFRWPWGKGCVCNPNPTKTPPKPNNTPSRSPDTNLGGGFSNWVCSPPPPPPPTPVFLGEHAGSAKEGQKKKVDGGKRDRMVGGGGEKKGAASQNNGSFGKKSRLQSRGGP